MLTLAGGLLVVGVILAILTGLASTSSA